MSFSTMNKPELLAIAEEMGGVDVDDKNTKPEILNAIADAGMTYQKWKALTEPEVLPEELEEETEPETVEEVFTGRQVIIKMERKNPTFEANGRKFTKEKPFAVVSEKEAQEIIDMFDGFRIATPHEAKIFYS